MKYGSDEIRRYRGYVTFVRGESKDDLHQLRIRIQTLPPTWQDECDRMLPEPVPPIVGKEFDSQGNSRPKHDPKEPRFVAEYTEWRHMVTAKKIHDSTVDPAIQWETDPALLEQDPRAYYRAIYQELAESFSGGEIAHWLVTINGSNQVGGADVALAEEGLFQAVSRLLAVPDVEAHAEQ